MIGWEYPPHNSGGLGVACQGLSRAIADRNSEVFFTLPYSLAGGVSHMRVLDCADPSWAASYSGLPPFSAYLATEQTQQAVTHEKVYAGTLPGSVLEQRAQQYSKTVLDKTAPHASDFEVIHAHDWMSFPAARAVKHKTGKPFIAHIHSTEYDRIPSGKGSSYITKTEFEGLQQADQVVAVSYYTKRLLVNRYQVDPNKIAVVHNGIDPLKTNRELDRNTTQYLKDRPVVVFMGRLTAQKGVEYFLTVAQKVLTSLPTALFVVAGSGDMYHELLFHTAANSLTASVLFSGFLRDTQRERLLDRADVFIMPSLSEPFGLVALESAQRNTPVVVSHTAGVSEVMPGAISVDFWDSEKMAKLVVALLKNKHYHQSVIKSQQEDIVQATWDRAADRLIEIYRTAFTGTR